MLETMLDRHLLLALVSVCAGIGVISKVVVSVSLNRLAKAAESMNKSSHPLMKLVRAKFEHTCMVSDKVQNVRVFVEKYIHEYKILGIRLHGWMRMEKGCAWASVVLGILAAAAEYSLRGMSEQVLRDAVFGAVIGVLLFVLRASADEQYQMRAVRTYMVDYLENVYARRLEKSRESFANREAGAERGRAVLAEQKPAEAEPKNPELDNPERPRPREEVPMPKEMPELDPPAMPEPYRAPESYIAPGAGTTAEGMKLAEAIVNGSGDKPVLSAVTEKSAEKPSERRREKVKEPRSKEVMIREILEEFLA